MASFLHGLVHYVVIPLAVPGTLAILAIAVRLTRVVWFRQRQKGFPPIRIKVAPDTDSAAFAAQLSEFLAQDTLQADLVIPPGGHGAEDAYPVEGLGNTVSWLSTIVGIALTAEPTFEVHVEFIRAPSGRSLHQVTMRTTRTPGNHVIVTAAMRHSSEEHLVTSMGCAIGHSIRQTPTVWRNTPRWERWSAEPDGYLKYRSALNKERDGNYKAALQQYNEAISHEPGNFVISMRKAALLELMHRYEEAATVYRTCWDLWAEHIEASYRLAAALTNSGRVRDADVVLDDLKESLRPRRIWRQRLRTWRKPRSQAGDRAYWKAWCRRRLIFLGPSKRQVFGNAARVGQLVAHMEGLVSGTYRRDDAKTLLAELDRLIRKRTLHRGYLRLLHPEQGARTLRAQRHDPGWHVDSDDKELRPYPPARHNKPRGGVGWLAHYNAAIFFSIAIALPDHEFPQAYSRKQWQADCARAAIFELGYVKRDPRNQLETAWYRTDPGLRSLRRFLRKHARRWSNFVGLGPPPSLRSRFFGKLPERWWPR